MVTPLGLEPDSNFDSSRLCDPGQLLNLPEILSSSIKWGFNNVCTLGICEDLTNSHEALSTVPGSQYGLRH